MPEQQADAIRHNAFRALPATLAVSGLVGLIVDRGRPFAVIALFGVSTLCIWWVRKRDDPAN